MPKEAIVFPEAASNPGTLDILESLLVSEGVPRWG